MKRAEKIEWFLRIVVFGSSIAVGVLGGWSVWRAFHDLGALLLFVLVFAILLVSMAYIVKKRKLGMLETR